MSEYWKMSTVLIKTKSTSIHNVQQVCRLCLSQELLEDIFSHKDLHLLISAYLSIVVSEVDIISRSICYLCLTRLHEFREFQLGCLEVQSILQNESSPVVKEEPFDEPEEAEPSSEAEYQLALANLQSTVVAAEHGNIAVLQSEPTPIAEADAELPTVAGENLQPTKRMKHCLDKKAECSICGEMVDESIMEGHQNRHKDLQPYKCIYGCKSISFYSEQDTRYHYLEMHNLQCHKCDACEKSFQSRKLFYRHKREAHMSYICPTCVKEFPNHNSLKRHMKLHDPKRTRNFPCPMCNLTFHLRTTLKRHMTIHDNPDKARIKGSPDMLKPLEVHTDPGVDCQETPACMPDNQHKFSIKIENTIFELKAYCDAVVAGSPSPVDCGGEPVELNPSLQKSAESSSQQQAESDSESNQQQNILCSEKLEGNPLISCRICSKQVRQSYMEDHLNKHNDFRLYKCKRGCDKRFRSVADRDHHHGLIHISQQWCDICRKMYPSKKSLKRHQTYMHEEKKNQQFHLP